MAAYLWPNTTWLAVRGHHIQSSPRPVTVGRCRPCKARQGKNRRWAVIAATQSYNLFGTLVLLFAPVVGVVLCSFIWQQDATKSRRHPSATNKKNASLLLQYLLLAYLPVDSQQKGWAAASLLHHPPSRRHFFFEIPISLFVFLPLPLFLRNLFPAKNSMHTDRNLWFIPDTRFSISLSTAPAKRTIVRAT